jgi:hypothetical protein
MHSVSTEATKALGLSSITGSVRAISKVINVTSRRDQQATSKDARKKPFHI